MILEEKDLRFDFSGSVDAFVFDQMDSSLPNYHGIDEMSKVDFIVETEESILFIEVKDPDCPNCSEEGVSRFHTKLNNGTLPKSFASKFIDTFLYRWAEDKLTKPIHYLSLVTIDNAQVVYLTDEIAKKIPPLGKDAPRWSRQLFQNCQVFNMEMWNEIFPQWPVSRISQSVATGE